MTVPATETLLDNTSLPTDTEPPKVAFSHTVKLSKILADPSTSIPSPNRVVLLTQQDPDTDKS
jgi:hypothetical protein